MSGFPYHGFYSLPQWTPYQQDSYPAARPFYVSNTSSAYSQPPYTHSPIGFAPDQSPQNTINQTSEPPVRRKRASKPKVRTGCTTCKIRRIKCDETKPNCSRCTSTGRRCDGYRFPRQDLDTSTTIFSTTEIPRHSTPQLEEQQIVKESHHVPEVFVSLLDSQSLNQTFRGTVQERRAFHRFKYRTVPAFAGGSEAEFWTILVLRAATTELVIREAVIALGSLHEDYENRDGQYSQSLTSSESAKNTTLLYGQAIRRLYQQIDTITGETASLAIIASILFACFEVLRRNNMAAVVHYQNGMRQLMKQMNGKSSHQLHCPPTKRIESTVVRSAPQDDLDRMLRVFARYDVQACTFSKPKVEPLNIILPAMPPNDIGLVDVRRYLDNLLIAVYQLLKSDLGMFRYWKSDEVSPAWLEKRDQALTTFQRWLDALEKSIPADSLTLRNHGMTASKSILGLILQIKVAMIMLRTCVDSGPETSFDRFRPEFEGMITRIEAMTKLVGLKAASPLERETVPFSMELGMIHPLFFIAWKCRDYKIRRRAVNELKKCGKEGVWEGPIIAVLAERIIQIEERGVRPGASVPESNRIHEIKKSIEYDDRTIRVDLRIAQDTTWRNWTNIREAIPF